MFLNIVFGLILTTISPVIFSQAELKAQKNLNKTRSLDVVTQIPDVQKIILGYLDIWEVQHAGTCELPIAVVAYSPCGRYIATGEISGQVKIWDAKTREKIHDLEISASAIHSIAFSPDGTLLAISAADSIIRLLDTERGVCLKTSDQLDDWTKALVYSPCGKYFASSTHSNGIKLWNGFDGSFLKSISMRSPERQIGEISAMAYSPCGKFIASCAGTEKEIKIWDIEKDMCVKILNDHSDKRTSTMYDLSYSPCGKFLVSKDHKSKTLVWNLATGQVLRKLKKHLYRVSHVNSHVKWSPCGRFIAGSGSSDFAIVIWDTQSDKLDVSECNKHAIDTISWSPCGNYLACGGLDRTLKIWFNQAKEIESADAGKK